MGIVWRHQEALVASDVAAAPDTALMVGSIDKPDPCINTRAILREAEALPDMELKWLEDYLAVAKLRNFSQAATARHLTQPALSRRIKALELWYGVPLVDRSTYPVTLTSEGVTFLALAEQIVADLYRSRREARASRDAAGLTVKFAMPHSLAVYFFPTWWRARRRRPDLQASVIAADLNECVELFLNGVCQFLLGYRHARLHGELDEPGLPGRRVGTAKLVPVCAVNNDGEPLFSLPPLAGQALPILAYTSESFLGKVSSLLHAELESRCELVLRYESALVEALKVEAMLGEGVAWLPEGMIESELRAGTLQIIGNDNYATSLEIWLYGPPSSTSASNGDFLDFPSKSDGSAQTTDHNSVAETSSIQNR